jgi:hypothetical protein
MSTATALSAPALAAAHRQFEGALPAMTEAIRFHARRWPRRLRGDAVEAARAACWLAWRGLLARGRDPLTVGVTAIAFNACRYVRNGRQFGCGTPGRATDVLDPQVCRRHGLRLVSLDEVEAADSWREWLACDNRVGPADEAAFRLDFAAWLESLPSRMRQIAVLLAAGHEGLVVARTVGVSPGRVCQLRPELERSWGEFQRQAEGDRRRVAAATGGSARS